MRKLYAILVAVLLTATVWAQVPKKMSYQAVIRNSNNTLVTNSPIGMQINIRLDSPTGMVVYTETLTTVSNDYGLVSVEIGGGAGFGNINWANGTYFIESKTAIVEPLTTYTITVVSRLLSVPYALHAKTVETITETDPIFNTSAAKAITNTNITNWNTAYTWGNHATQGYLTTVTETDPVFALSPAKNITNANITTWNSLKNVNITAGNGITVSGTYPNITITNNVTQNDDTNYIGKPWYEADTLAGYIIYLDHTKQHGIVLHKKQTGASNSTTIATLISTNYPGWSIPTVEQMNEAYKNMYRFNKIEGVTKISAFNYYWIAISSASYQIVKYFLAPVNAGPTTGASSRMVKEF